MAKKTGSDYIPTEAELIRIEDERKAYMEAHPNQLKSYLVSYKLNGTVLSETVKARTNADAISHLKQQCGMVGWMPYDITCEEVK